jgi:hypothetical protein
MRRLVLTFAMLPVLFGASTLMAQDGDRVLRPRGQDPAVDQVAQTEDMWFYLQELRRYDDPQVVIRNKAELKGEQRRHRLAAMKWFGWSQSRPSASPVPTMGVYSPTWVGNGSDPYHWIGNAYLTTAVRIDTHSDTTRR